MANGAGQDLGAQGRLHTIGEVAEWLGTSERHVRRLVQEKRIPYVKVGWLVRFDPIVVRRWIDSNACKRT